MPKSRGGGGAKVVQQQPQRPRNLHRYKTELCRAWGENRNCKYGDKCQVSTPLASFFLFVSINLSQALKTMTQVPFAVCACTILRAGF